MSKVYFTTLESEFAKELSAIYAKEGFEVVTEPGPGIEYFVDTTDAYVEGDDKKVGQGVSMEAAAEAYRKNVCEPLMKLEKVIPWMTGKKRIVFINSRKSSISLSEETAGFGHNMSKASINLIMCLTKNGLIKRGYTFRLFDPMAGQVAADLAARSGYGYITRDRFFDDPTDGLDRFDEENLIVRDALGREIPW